MKTTILILLTPLFFLSSFSQNDNQKDKATVLFILHKNLQVTKLPLLILNNDKYVASLNQDVNYYLEEINTGEQLFWTQLIEKHSLTEDVKANEIYIVFFKIKYRFFNYPKVEIKIIQPNEVDQLKKRERKKVIEIIHLLNLKS